MAALVHQPKDERRGCSAERALGHRSATPAPADVALGEKFATSVEKFINKAGAALGSVLQKDCRPRRTGYLIHPS